MKKHLQIALAALAFAAAAMAGNSQAAPDGAANPGATVEAGVASHADGDRSDGTRTLRDFGAVGNGSVDDTAALQRAFDWLASGNRTLYGEPLKTYKVSAKLNVSGTHVHFDCRQCILKNTINAQPADPLISITDTASTFIRLSNFTVQFDVASNKGHAIAIIGNGHGPQAIDLENIRINSQTGRGKDHNGAPMPAYGVYVYGVYTVNVDRLYISNGSGGLYFDTVQKVSVARTVVDKVANYGMWFEKVENAEVGQMSNVTGAGQENQAAVYFNGCESFTFRDSRVKGGAGSQIMAGDLVSRNIDIDSNHIEVYNPHHRAIYLKTNTKSASVTNNFIKHIGGNGPFDASIAVVEGPGAQSRGAFVISHNLVSVGGADTLSDAILLRAAADRIDSAVVESNSIGDSNSVAGVVVNAIDLRANGAGNVVRNNIIGAPHTTVMHGVTIGSGSTSAVVENNTAGGTVKTMLDDNGTGTRIYQSGSWTPVLRGTTVTGNNKYRQQVGSYRRIDDVVYFTASFTLEALDPALSGNVVLDGLPFVSASTPGASGGAQVAAARFTFPAGTTQIGAVVPPASREIRFSFSGPGAVPVTATAANVANASTAIVSGFYFAK